ncbi:MAG: NUDIX hydrolase [Caldilineaceae bacterium]
MAILHNSCLLLVRQTYRGNTFWTFPGGKVEPGEEPEQTAVREVEEETNLRVKAKSLLYQGVRKNGEGTYYCYLGKIIGGEARLGCDPELHELRWFPIQEIKDHPEVARILDRLNHQ